MSWIYEDNNIPLYPNNLNHLVTTYDRVQKKDGKERALYWALQTVRSGVLMEDYPRDAVLPDLWVRNYNHTLQNIVTDIWLHLGNPPTDHAMVGFLVNMARPSPSKLVAAQGLIRDLTDLITPLDPKSPLVPFALPLLERLRAYQQPTWTTEEWRHLVKRRYAILGWGILRKLDNLIGEFVTGTSPGNPGVGSADLLCLEYLRLGTNNIFTPAWIEAMTSALDHVVVFARALYDCVSEADPGMEFPNLFEHPRFRAGYPVQAYNLPLGVPTRKNGWPWHDVRARVQWKLPNPAPALAYYDSAGKPIYLMSHPMIIRAGWRSNPPNFKVEWQDSAPAVVHLPDVSNVYKLQARFRPVMADLPDHATPDRPLPDLPPVSAYQHLTSLRTLPLTTKYVSGAKELDSQLFSGSFACAVLLTGSTILDFRHGLCAR